MTEQLLDAVTSGDMETFSTLCDSQLTCFAPEAAGNLLHGLDFHKFYFDNGMSTLITVCNHEQFLCHPKSLAILSLPLEQS